MTAEGKGVNVARVLARHGHSVVLTGFAGGHSGAWLRDLIRADGIAEDCVPTTAPVRVGFMATACDLNHPTTVFPSGFAVTTDEYHALLERIEAWSASVRLVIASGSVPDPVTEGLYAELLELCHRRGLPCWLDAYGPAMRRALEGPVAPTLAKPNRQEHQPGFRWDRVEEMHITDGAGTILVDSRTGGHWRVAPPAIRQINPIGSGDCYLAGLAHGWLEGWDTERRLRYAAAAGSANACHPEVATITPGDVEPLLPHVSVEILDRP
jgi:fructose-1-phosphate kinase PfkB-like protein